MLLGIFVIAILGVAAIFFCLSLLNCAVSLLLLAASALPALLTAWILSCFIPQLLAIIFAVIIFILLLRIMLHIKHLLVMIVATLFFLLTAGAITYFINL